MKKLTLEEADKMIAEGRSPLKEGFEIESFEENFIRLIYENTTNRPSRDKSEGEEK